jgi:hypothetical protein
MFVVGEVSIAGELPGYAFGGIDMFITCGKSMKKQSNDYVPWRNKQENGIQARPQHRLMP